MLQAVLYVSIHLVKSSVMMGFQQLSYVIMIFYGIRNQLQTYINSSLY